MHIGNETTLGSKISRNNFECAKRSLRNWPKIRVRLAIGVGIIPVISRVFTLKIEIFTGIGKTVIALDGGKKCILRYPNFLCELFQSVGVNHDPGLFERFG